MPEKRFPPQPTKAKNPPETNGPQGDAECQPGRDASTSAGEDLEECRIVKEWHVKEDRLDFTELVRSIQRADGNQDCFKKKCTCQEMGCAWRTYCLNEPTDVTP